MNDKIQLRRGTLANWLKYDPVLADGEMALVATDASKPTVYDSQKVGDGTHKFSELEMLGYKCLQELGDSQQFPMSQKAITDWVNKGYQFRGVATPSTNPGTPDGPIFYFATKAGIYANFNSISVADGEAVILQWDNGAWTKKTTGFATEQEIIYDVSARNDGAVFESLQALLSSSNLSTLIPTSVRCGGMSIRFIQGSVPNSDNKYVQYRLMSNSFNTTVANWQGVDDVPTIGSNNLVKSGGVAEELVLGAVYDVSAKNPTAGTNNNGKWESLSALLSDTNLNTLIPTSVRKGGMSIKFVQSGNKYEQWMYMGTSISDTTFTNITNWQSSVDTNTKSTYDKKERILITMDNDEYVGHVDGQGLHTKELFIQSTESQEGVSLNSLLDKKQDNIGIEAQLPNNRKSLFEIWDDNKTVKYCSLDSEGLFAPDLFNKDGLVDVKLFDRYNLTDFIIDFPIFKQNKTAVFFGDSITYGVGASDNSKRFTSIFCQLAGFMETNKGVSGSVLDPEIASEYSKDNITARIKTTEISNYDYVFIAGGTNDVALGVTADRLYDVVYSLCEWIVINKGNAKVYFITPINKVTSKGANCTIDNARRSIAEAAVQFNCNILDGSSIPFPSFASRWSKIVLPDGLHPSDIGHSLYAKYLYSKLLNN